MPSHSGVLQVGPSWSTHLPGREHCETFTASRVMAAALRLTASPAAQRAEGPWRVQRPWRPPPWSRRRRRRPSRRRPTGRALAWRLPRMMRHHGSSRPRLASRRVAGPPAAPGTLAADTIASPSSSTPGAPLQVQELLPGSGPTAGANDSVLVDYVLRRSNGYFIYGTVEGVSFQPRDVPVGPVLLQLGRGSVVPGLEEALVGMAAGEQLWGRGRGGGGSGADSGGDRGQQGGRQRQTPATLACGGGPRRAERVPWRGGAGQGRHQVPWLSGGGWAAAATTPGCLLDRVCRGEAQNPGAPRVGLHGAGGRGAGAGNAHLWHEAPVGQPRSGAAAV